MNATAQRTQILCVDDNPLVIDAIRVKLARSTEFQLIGWLPSAEGLIERAGVDAPDIVLLDLDMPGPDPLSVCEQLHKTSPEIRVVVFTGHVRPDLIERALESGAWGYISKNDAESELVTILQLVMNDKIGLSTEARATYNRI